MTLRFGGNPIPSFLSIIGDCSILKPVLHRCFTSRTTGGIVAFQSQHSWQTGVGSHHTGWKSHDSRFSPDRAARGTGLAACREATPRHPARFKDWYDGHLHEESVAHGSSQLRTAHGQVPPTRVRGTKRDHGASPIHVIGLFFHISLNPTAQI